MEKILATMARLESKLDERDRRLGITIPPPRPEPDPPDMPPMYSAEQLRFQSTCYLPRHTADQPPHPDYPPPHTDFQRQHNTTPQSCWLNLNLGWFPNDTAQQQPYSGSASPTTYPATEYLGPQPENQPLTVQNQQPTDPYYRPDEYKPARAYQPYTQSPHTDQQPYAWQQPPSYHHRQSYEPPRNPYVEYHPWQQDQLVYHPPPPTEWSPPQHSPSCWSPANSHRQVGSGLENSFAMQQPLPHFPSPYKSPTSHCLPAAPPPVAAVVQPLNLPPPTAISPPSSPNVSPVLASDVVLAAIVPSSMKEETSDGVINQFGDSYSSLFEEKKVNGETHKFDDIFILGESDQYGIAICNAAAVAKSKTTHILHILEHDWIWSDQSNFKDICYAGYYIPDLNTGSIGNYKGKEQFYVIDPGGDTSPKFLLLMFFVVTWFPP